jgi:hypothetical protein
VTTRTPDDVTKLRRFFGAPGSPRQRQYEALRAYFFEQSPSAEVAKRFGYSAGAFRVLCHTFRRGELPDFFAVGRPGPRTQPKKSAAVASLPGWRITAETEREKNHIPGDFFSAERQNNPVRICLYARFFPPRTLHTSRFGNEDKTPLASGQEQALTTKSVFC